jgi:hypothetical protein
MKPLFLSSVRSGLMTLGLVAGLTAPSLAGPILQPDLSIPVNSAASGITPVRDGWAGNNDRNVYQDWRWRNRGSNFRERRFSRNWDNGDDWRWRRHHHRRHFRGGDAALLGLGLGLGLGSLAYGNYYDPYPRYVQPRRIYRSSNAHVQWCYDRYRSYRAWDNTFQPYHGPRQQCWSPYS